MLIRVTTVEVCDATDDASSNAADKPKKIKRGDCFASQEKLIN